MDSGHVQRREESYVGKRVREMEVSGVRKVGKPRKRWKDCIAKDLEAKNLTGEEVDCRPEWRRLTKNADPT